MYGEMGVQLDLWVLVIAMGVLPVIAGFRFLRARRSRPGACTVCGYNLTGNTSGVCPECGAAITGEASDRKLGVDSTR
jgi:predicted RNA-binding Zn-ribbon protein involved in translation (DUF1610 family)